MDTKQISKDVSKELEIDFDEAAVELVGEMVFKKLLLYGSDLEAFCKYVCTYVWTCICISTRDTIIFKRLLVLYLQTC